MTLFLKRSTKLHTGAFATPICRENTTLFVRMRQDFLIEYSGWIINAHHFDIMAEVAKECSKTAFYILIEEKLHRCVGLAGRS